MSTLSFSDSESTGDSRDTADGSQLDMSTCNRSHDDVWMNEVMNELDHYMQNAPVTMLLKWRNIKTLTAVYYDGLKETQLELEAESKKVFDAGEALQHVSHALAQVSAKLAEVEAERDALAAHQKRVHEMLVHKLNEWEIVDDDSE